MDTNDLSKMIVELEDAFREVQQPRSPFALEHFVLGAHDTEPRQYAQCVLELQIKYDAIRRALLHKERLQIEIEELERQANGEGGPKAKINLVEAKLKCIDIEEQDRAILGAVREFETLYQMWQAFPHRYTRTELDAAQEEYWRKRLTRQANQDRQAVGRVSVGNQEALRQIGMAATPQLGHVRDVERRYLESGDCKILIAVPTIEKAEAGLPCIENLAFPSGVQAKIYNVWGRPVDDAYNDAAMTLLQDRADFMLTIEDDTFPPPDALVRLLNHLRGNTDKVIVGAWYPKRNEAQEGTPIVLKGGERQALEADGEVHECYTLPMGCTLFPAEVFLQTDSPWFASTTHLSQDSFFSQKAREAGWTLLCDTSIRCRHVDRETGKGYGPMFAHLSNYRVILVSGPQRSGTRLVAHAIAEDTGHRYVDESYFGTFKNSKLDQLLEKSQIVVQCPAVARWVHEYSADDVLIVFVRRDIEEIIVSQDRIGWTERYEWGELQNYEADEGPIARVKYDFWEQHQRRHIEHWLEVEYESLKEHPLWVAKAKRGTDWQPDQWHLRYPGQEFSGGQR